MSYAIAQAKVTRVSVRGKRACRSCSLELTRVFVAQTPGFDSSYIYIVVLLPAAARNAGSKNRNIQTTIDVNQERCVSMIDRSVSQVT